MLYSVSTQHCSRGCWGSPKLEKPLAEHLAGVQQSFGNSTGWRWVGGGSSKSKSLFFLGLSAFVCILIFMHSPRPPANVYSQLERRSLCADVQSQVKTLRLALPSNFLACPSLNIDIAPQLRRWILLRVDTAELTAGSNDTFVHR